MYQLSDTSERPENAENYLLYSGICSIPDSFSNHSRELVSVSRAVCRKACSNIFTNDCSGFLYNRRTQTCTLSPYTGEKLSATAADCDPRNGLEFYRRIRSSGNVRDLLYCGMQCVVLSAEVDHVSNTKHVVPEAEINADQFFSHIHGMRVL